jgi:CBS domain-containing protein
VRVETTDPVGLAVRLMQNADTDCVLVLSGSQLAGIITPWDILHKVAGPNEDLNAVTCGQVMTADPVFLRMDDDVAVAINKMSIGGFRHIPLLEGATPVGVLSIRDVFRHIAPHLA